MTLKNLVMRAHFSVPITQKHAINNLMSQSTSLVAYSIIMTVTLMCNRLGQL